MDRLKPFTEFVIFRGGLYLHSNMDRLKLKNVVPIIENLVNLHSNMDRLKLALGVWVIFLRLIYIPIWID